MDIVYDIECVGPKDVDDPTFNYLQKRALDKAARDGVEPVNPEERYALELGLARVACVGMHLVDEQRTHVLAMRHGDLEAHRNIEDGNLKVTCYSSELLLLRDFWTIVSKQRPLPRLVGFHIRTYDGPVLMTRSAQLGVVCKRDLIPYRYDLAQVCDLADVLTWQGAVRNSYTVDYWCCRFGIESPKDEGVTGADVQTLYDVGEMMAIVRYCARDVEQEAELYKALCRSFAHLFKGGPALLPPDQSGELFPKMSA